MPVTRVREHAAFDDEIGKNGSLEKVLESVAVALFRMEQGIQLART